MNILVTGAAGFIGSSTAAALMKRGDRVVGIDNINDYYDTKLKHDRLKRLLDEFDDAFDFRRIDFSDAAALRSELDSADFDRIIHLGAQAGVRYSIENPGAYVQSNLVGHANVLEMARQRGSSHFVYASSSSVYGGNTNLPFRVEDRVDHPLSLYAATKKADELITESYANLFRLPATGLRFFTVYGPWGRPDMAMWIFLKALMEDRELPVFNGGDMRRDFTYIDDIVAGIIACLDNPPADNGEPKAGGSRTPHALYNIGNNRSEHLMRVIELLERGSNKKARIKALPMQPGDVQDTFADISAIERDHGYKPATTIDQGVPQFVDWYRRYHDL